MLHYFRLNSLESETSNLERTLAIKCYRNSRLNHPSHQGIQMQGFQKHKSETNQKEEMQRDRNEFAN